jgi:hypothetical protein
LDTLSDLYICFFEKKKEEREKKKEERGITREVNDEHKEESGTNSAISFLLLPSSCF